MLLAEQKALMKKKLIIACVLTALCGNAWA